MKKRSAISAMLCLCMALSCLAMPVSATGISLTEPVETTTETTAPSAETQTQQTQTQPTSQPATAATTLPFGQACIQQGCRTLDGMMPLAGSERRLATAQGVFVYELNSQTVVYSYNPDVKLSPGTLSKIVTAMVAIENCKLDEVVRCSEGIQSKVPGSSQKVQLKSNEELTVEELLYCLLMHSANDAAVALAEHVSGSTAAYLELMNKWVKQHGCVNTQLGNISGLDTAVSYTTARDMARIMAVAAQDDVFVRISGTAKHTVPATNLAEERKLVTTNYMIDNSIIPQFLDDRVKSGLASYSDASNANLALCSEYNKMKLVCVVIGCTRVFDAKDTWKATSYGNFNEMQILLDYLYKGFKVNRILYDGQALGQFSVIGGECDVVGGPRIAYDTVLPIDCSMDNLYTTYKAVNGGYTAPINKGDLIATVAVQYRNSCVAEAEIYAMNSVIRTEDSQVTIHNTAVKRDSDMEGFSGFLGSVGVLAVGGFGVYVAYNTYRRIRKRMRHQRRRASRRRSE